jgi:hypothetical protein
LTTFSRQPEKTAVSTSNEQTPPPDNVLSMKEDKPVDVWVTFPFHFRLK